MRYIDIIQSGIDYIEENLKTDITAEELSARAGFSLFHYYRLFQSVVGMSVMQYIVRRRLLWAAYDIANGKTQIEAALSYGFDTSAGFYKAFRRELGCSPSEFVKRYRVRKPCCIYLLKEEHIMITVKRVKDVLENWDLREETVKNVVHPAGFISENTFCVGESYLIKAYTVPGKAKNNAEILSALKEAGLSKAAAVPTKSGESFAADGEFCFLLMERIPGETMEVSEMFSPDASAKARYLGEIIGQLHLVLKANDEIVCNERNIFEEVRDQWLEPAKAAMELPDGFCEEYAEAFGALHDKLPVQMIHRDPNLSNIILKDGKIAGFIDFELSQRSIRLFDPCYAATGILAESGAAEQNDGEKLRQWLSIYKDIIRGYDSVVHLTREEKQALPYVVFSIQLICVGYFSGEEKFRELADTNIAMLRWLLNNREQLEI